MIPKTLLIDRLKCDVCGTEFAGNADTIREMLERHKLNEHATLDVRMTAELDELRAENALLKKKIEVLEATMPGRIAQDLDEALDGLDAILQQEKSENGTVNDNG